MLRPLVRCLALPVLIVACAQAAFAGELIEGDGFEFRVPPGFHGLPTKDDGT